MIFLLYRELFGRKKSNTDRPFQQLMLLVGMISGLEMERRKLAW
jgi:hypothetical protein